MSLRFQKGELSCTHYILRQCEKLPVFLIEPHFSALVYFPLTFANRKGGYEGDAQAPQCAEGATFIVDTVFVGRDSHLSFRPAAQTIRAIP